MTDEFEQIFFDEEQLKDLDGLAEKMQVPENDPRSIYYIRKLERPDICLWKVAAAVLLPIIVSAGIFFVSKAVFDSTPVGVTAALCALTAYLAVMSKRYFVCMIRIYQRYAPDRIRNKCRFEPSCSEYMLLAIEKYGFFAGVKKGIHRLLRCNENNGGYDYP